jgi:hypothetical protein
MLSDPIAKELEELQRQNAGLLLPKAVVDFARDPSSALHAHFEWDDAKAAEDHRLNQARRIIRLHVTVIAEDRPPIRALVSLTTDRATGGGYRTITAVLADEDQRQQMLEDALNELRRVRWKYQQIEQLQPVWEAMTMVAQQTQEPDRKTG